MLPIRMRNNKKWFSLRMMLFLVICMASVLPQKAEAVQQNQKPVQQNQKATQQNQKTTQQNQVVSQQKKEAAEQLGKALDYFVSKKYHECLMIMQDLDKHYRLNPRYKAYLGVCYYYDWDYKNAVKYLDEAIPQLGNFAPHERSFYYWADAESYFNLQKYAEAIPLYETMLTVCYENEKPDAYYRMGFCYLFAENWVGAWNNLLQARDGYLASRNTPDMQDGLKPKVVGNVIENLLKK